MFCGEFVRSKNSSAKCSDTLEMLKVRKLLDASTTKWAKKFMFSNPSAQFCQQLGRTPIPTAS
jgi:hypothetical protein